VFVEEIELYLFIYELLSKIDVEESFAIHFTHSNQYSCHVKTALLDSIVREFNKTSKCELEIVCAKQIQSFALHNGF
jgi:hypothetical protein